MCSRFAATRHKPQNYLACRGTSPSLIPSTTRCSSTICIRSTFKATWDDWTFAAFASIICLASVSGGNRLDWCWAAIFALTTSVKTFNCTNSSSSHGNADITDNLLLDLIANTNRLSWAIGCRFNSNEHGVSLHSVITKRKYNIITRHYKSISLLPRMFTGL